MTLQEFVQKFKTIAPNYRWELNKGQVLRTTVDGLCHCPITLVLHHRTRGRESYPAHMVSVAANLLDLSHEDEELIVMAADDLPLPPGTEIQKVRQELLTACGPLEDQL